jgi:hypothetical protein
MIDIKQTDDGDLDLTSGDIEWVEPTGQHQRDILVAAPGDYKENPPMGVDSVRYILDVDPAEYLRRIRKQLSADGQKVRALSYNEHTGKTDIDAEYENS